MEKVKLTQEQADAIEILRGKYINDWAVVNNSVMYKMTDDVPFDRSYDKLSKLHLDDLIRALYIGYEVEPQFKVGDWVCVSWSNGKPTIHKVTEPVKHNEVGIDGGQINKHPSLHVVRHATIGEIATEKQRRWWAKHDRDVWEIKEDDTLTCIGVPYIVDWFNSEVVRFKSGKNNAGFTETFDYVKEHFEVFCFAEDRKDLNDTE